MKKVSLQFPGLKRGEFPQKTVKKVHKLQLSHWRNILYCSSNEIVKCRAVTVNVKLLSAHDFC